MAKRKILSALLAASILSGLVSCDIFVPSIPSEDNSTSMATSENVSEINSNDVTSSSVIGSLNASSEATTINNTTTSQGTSIVNTTTSNSQTSAVTSKVSNTSNNQTSVATTSAPATTSASTSATSNTGFQITTDLNATKEIHTAQQKTYLNYSGTYETIPENQYPDGKQHISEPNAVNLAWNYTPISGKTLKNYSVTFGQKSDLSDGYTKVGTTATSLDLYNVYLGKNYFKINANYSDNSVVSSEIKSFNVDTQAPRNLKIDGMTNCRDMGGRTNNAGGKIKQGMIFRTSATNSWGNGKAVISDNISSAGKEELINHLGVKTEINVNGSGSNQVGVQNFVGAFMDYNGGKHHFSRNAESVKKVFETLSNANNYPLFYHCRIGTDRTGLCALLINGLLGVSENEIFQDYLFSNFGNIQEKRYLGDRAGEDNILIYVNEIRSMPGTTFQNKVYNTLLSIGVPKAQLDTVIDLLTEGNKPTGNDNGQLVGIGNGLTPNGLNKSTSSDRGNPSIYYSLTSTSHSVSYSFTTGEAYTGKIVAYLGNSSNSTSKNLNSTLSLKLDGQDVTIGSKNYSEAGFGTCSNRTCYYFNILGEVSLSAGTHTLTLGLKTDSMKVGALSIFNVGKATNPGGNTSVDTPTPHTHSYTKTSTVKNSDNKDCNVYDCSCGGGYVAIKFADYSGTYTFDSTNPYKIKTNNEVQWKIVAPKAGKVKVAFAAKMSSSSHKSQNIANKFKVTCNGTTGTICCSGTYGDNGLSTESNTYIEVAEVNVIAGENTIGLTHIDTSGYRLLYNDEVRIIYQ